MKEGVTDYLKTWESLGFSFAEGLTASKEAITDNVFDDNKNKLYVNTETGQWVAYGHSGKSGNIHTFVHEFYEWCASRTHVRDLLLLAEEKKIPVQAFEKEVAYNPLNGTYLIPFKNYDGQVRGLQYYNIGSKCRNIKNLPTQLWNIDEIKRKPGRAIWLCEGAWDGIALKWAMKSCGEDGISIAIQGGNPFGFKESFIPLFNKKSVKVCYDKDNAGEEGEERVFAMLQKISSELLFLAWPTVMRDKYDIRDYINEHGGNPDYPKTALKNVINTLKTFMSKQTTRQRIRARDESKLPIKDVIIPDYKEVEARFNKWLSMKSNIPLAVMFGAVFANKMSSKDPIWIFLVAPPAGMKTELISKLCKSPRICTVNKLTPAGLISGYKFGAGEDPSLLVEANLKTLVITDFTTIIEGNRMIRDEIFSILRDAYDGRVEKQYAKFKKIIESHFGIIAATTPVIDSASSINSALGERFLKYRIEKNHSETDEEERMFKAVTNVGIEDEMNQELQDVSYRFLETPIPEKPPMLAPHQVRRLIHLAKFTARARAQLVDDPFTGETLVSPFAEFGTRLVKQFVKLALGISIYYNELDNVNDRTIDILKEVAIDTCPQISVELIRSIHFRVLQQGSCTMQDVADDISVSVSTVSRKADRMIQLQMLKRISGGFGHKITYALTDKMLSLIEKSAIFTVEALTTKKLKIRI